MADEEHVKWLTSGDVWAVWRHKNEKIHLDLSDADLMGKNLSNMNLAGVNLSGARLCNADMRWANLGGANMNLANITGGNLVNAKLHKANLDNANLIDANLSSANLTDASLAGAVLINAKLHNTNFTRANLARANLTGAELINADCSYANLSNATLVQAQLDAVKLTATNLTQANLSLTDFYVSSFSGTDVTGATLFETVFGNVDLSGATGLDACFHAGASIIDFRALQKSGLLPLTFLRGIGLPDNFIQYLPSLLNQPIEHYSCFISYSTKDQDFAHRLYPDLQNKGVRCWFAPHDMPIGGRILDEIDAAIRLRDKVLLILSEHSIQSGWVEDEVTKAFEEERKHDKIVLFPIRLDDAVMETNEAWAAKLRARHIGDFRRWKDHDEYQKSFERVLRDLTVKKP